MRRVRADGVKNCPRCGEFIPNNEQPGAYPGATSRTDNKTEICSACGTAEGLEDFLSEIMPQAQWVKNRGKTSIAFAGDVMDMERAEKLP